MVIYRKIVNLNLDINPEPDNHSDRDLMIKKPSEKEDNYDWISFCIYHQQQINFNIKFKYRYYKIFIKYYE